MIRLNEPFGSSRPEAAATEALAAAAVFESGGAIERSLGLEHRPAQAEMSAATAEAFIGNHPLLFEAGTGVGKSLAYLVPAIAHAVSTERQAVISTHTISLQEQILHNDLHLTRELFGRVADLQAYRNFRATLLVGRGNYLCPTRLAEAVSGQGELFPDAEKQELERIAEWMHHTRTGLLNELSPLPPWEILEAVNADGAACNRRNCSPDVCFFQRAREAVRKSQVVVVNHSLLFALIGAGAAPGGDTPGILLPNDFAVLDEAHTVPAVATEYLGENVSSYGLRRLLLRLFNPMARKPRGLLLRYGSSGDSELVNQAVAACDQFFDDARRQFLTKNDVVRLREAEWSGIGPHPLLRQLSQRVGRAADQLEEGPPQDELTDVRTRLNGYAAGLRDMLALGNDEYVYWIEKSGRRGQNVQLRTAPIDIGPHLREILFTRHTGVLLTSATLGGGRDTRAFRARIGADEVDSRQSQSPFDYDRQMRVFIATDMPAPSRQTGRLDREYLSDAVAWCIEAVAGGSLVLFTSYADMRHVAASVGPRCADAGRPFLLQGDGRARTALTEEFRTAGNGVLFGTDSFWAGVDVPGPALSQVIITRLPFENPSHPTAEARSDWIRDRGGSPFAEMTLPDAVVKFRQGIGRLIRKRTDLGTITILDSRVVHKSYGRHFLQALPTGRVTRFNRQNRDWKFEALEAQPE